jgi:hypothetical protein
MSVKKVFLHDGPRGPSEYWLLASRDIHLQMLARKAYVGARQNSFCFSKYSKLTLIACIFGNKYEF